MCCKQHNGASEKTTYKMEGKTAKYVSDNRCISLLGLL